MGITVHVLTALLSLSPQQPPANGTPPPPPLERLLPATVPVAVVVGDVLGQQAALEQTAVWRLVAGSSGFAALQGGMSRVWRELAVETGMSPSEMQPAFGHGVALAFTGMQDGRPGLLAVVDSGDSTDAVRRALAERFPDARTSTHVGTEIRSVRQGSAEVHTAFAGRRSFFATDRAALEQSLLLLQGGTSLGNSGDYPPAPDDGKPVLLTVVARPTALLATARDALASRPEVPFDRLVAALELDKVTLASASVRLDGKELVTDTRLDSRAGGLLAALLGHAGELGSRSSRVVPPRAEGFFAWAVQLGEVIDAGLAVADAIEPTARKTVNAQLDQLRARLGVDLRDDLLHNFGAQLVGAQWRRGSAQEYALLVQVGDETRFQAALAALAKLSPVPLRRSTVQGQETLQLGNELADGVQPCLAVAGGNLLVASNPAALDDALRQVLSPLSNPAAVSFFGSLPPGATMASLSPTANTLNAQAAMLAQAGLQVDAAALGDLGDTRKVLVRDDHGAHGNSRSQLGGVELLALAGIGGAVVMPQLLAETPRAGSKPVARTNKPTPPAKAPTPVAKAAPTAKTPPAAKATETPKPTAKAPATPTPPAPPEPPAGPTAALQQLATANTAYQHGKGSDADQDGTGEFGSLTDLVRDGRLTALHLATTERTDQFVTTDGWCLASVLPESTDERETTWAAVAWAKAADARVYVLLADGSLHRHDTLRANGDTTAFEPSQVFADNRPGSPLVPGFVGVASLEHPATAAELAVLTAAEGAGKKADAAELQPLLTSPSGSVVARAAWLLGSLRQPGSVEPLAAALQAQEAPTVRLQLAAALARHADVASMPALCTALADRDAAVRAQAAKGLAAVRHQRARDGLLALLDSHGKDRDGKGLDVAAALLALADSSDGTSLMPAANAVDHADPRVQQALVFLFQTCSPKLAAREEATLLTAVLDHPTALLRKFAIQRLAELADPTTAAALEGRLASEGAELRPQLENALVAVRGHHGDGNANGEGFLAKAKATADAALEAARRTWNGLDQQQQMLAGGGALGFVLLLFVLRALRRRQQRRRRIAELAAMVAPSSPEFEPTAPEAAAEPQAEPELTALDDPTAVVEEEATTGR